jgi:hypothetical protein
VGSSHISSWVKGFSAPTIPGRLTSERGYYDYPGCPGHRQIQVPNIPHQRSGTSLHQPATAWACIQETCAPAFRSRAVCRCERFLISFQIELAGTYTRTVSRSRVSPINLASFATRLTRPTPGLSIIPITHFQLPPVDPICYLSFGYRSSSYAICPC